MFIRTIKLAGGTFWFRFLRAELYAAGRSVKTVRDSDETGWQGLEWEVTLNRSVTLTPGPKRCYFRFNGKSCQYDEVLRLVVDSPSLKLIRVHNSQNFMTTHKNFVDSVSRQHYYAAHSLPLIPLSY